MMCVAALQKSIGAMSELRVTERGIRLRFLGPSTDDKENVAGWLKAVITTITYHFPEVYPINGPIPGMSCLLEKI
jgi:hypothetical protein